MRNMILAAAVSAIALAATPPAMAQRTAETPMLPVRADVGDGRVLITLPAIPKLSHIC